MQTLREYNEQESDGLFRSCEELVSGKKEHTTGDLGLLVLTIFAVKARSALYDGVGHFAY